MWKIVGYKMWDFKISGGYFRQKMRAELAESQPACSSLSWIKSYLLSRHCLIVFGFMKVKKLDILLCLVQADI